MPDPHGRFELRAVVPHDAFYEVTFAMKVGNAGAWTLVGTDDNAPYRVYPNVSGLAPGTPVHFRAVVRDNAGHESVATASASVQP